MRPFDLRSRPLRIAAGALVATTPVTAAVALAAVQTDSPGAVVPTTLTRAHLRYGERLVASGHLGAARAGRPLALQFQRAGGEWVMAAGGQVGRDGSYSLTGRPTSSGAARVVLGGPAGPRTANAAGARRAVTAPGAAAQHITVAARVSTRSRGIHVLSGRRATLTGRLRPARSGRRVSLQARVREHWRTVDHAATGARGRFAFGFRASRVGSAPLRVRFAGDRANGRATRRGGTLNVYRRSTASWYQLTGNKLACGGTMSAGTLGVANKSLACGTPVTIRYRGRSVRVRVVDRGPFVGGREWDLSAAAARALGFGGVGTIWTTR